MPKEKYDFKGKSFDKYRKESGPTLDEQESRLSVVREEGLEGDYVRSPSDVRDDYWGDVDRAKRDKGEPKARKTRPYKRPRKLVRKFPTRTSKRTVYR